MDCLVLDLHVLEALSAVFTDVIFDRDGVAYLHIHSAKVDFEQRVRLDHSEKRLAHLLLSEQLGRESVAFEDFLVVDRQRHETYVGHFVVQDCVEDYVQHLQLRLQDLASSGPGPFDEELQIVVFPQQQLDVLIEDYFVKTRVLILLGLVEKGSRTPDEKRNNRGIEQRLVRHDIR